MSHKPSAVFTLHDGFYVGSLRAPPGIDLVQILETSRDVLDRFGGHAGAAGCTIRADMMQKACTMLQKSAKTLYAHHDLMPVLRVDSVLDPDHITSQTVLEIESLRPFGIGFPAPVFLLENISAPIMPLGQTGEHVRWERVGPLEIVGFRMAEHVPLFSQKKVHLIGTLKSHSWRGVVTPQFQVQDAVIL